MDIFISLKKKIFVRGCANIKIVHIVKNIQKAIHIMSRSPINEKKKINNFLEYGTIDDFDEERCILWTLIAILGDLGTVRNGGAYEYSNRNESCDKNIS